MKNFKLPPKKSDLFRERALASFARVTNNSISDTLFDDSDIIVVANNYSITDKESISRLPAPVQLPSPIQISSTDSNVSAGYHNGSNDITPYMIEQAMIARYHFRIVGNALYVFGGRAYDLLDKETAHRLIYSCYQNYIGEYGRPDIVRQVHDFILMENKFVDDECEEDDSHIIMMNGRYNLKTDRFEANTPDVFQTSHLIIEYDENDTECPTFLQFLNKVSGGDKHIMKRLLESLGYLLSPSMAAKVFFVAYGPGNTGKSIFLKLVASFFPQKAVSNVQLQNLGGRFSTGDLVGKRLNTGGDLPHKTISADDIMNVKEYTGGDPIQAEKKYIQPFSYKPTCKLLFATNHRLHTAYNDEQFNERLVILPFLNVVPKDEQDHKLLEKMKQERTAIFNLALKHFKKLEKNNFIFTECPTLTNQFSMSSTVSSAPIQWDGNPLVKEFVENYCVFRDELDGKRCFTATDDLYTGFTAYCAAANAFPVTKDKFSKDFKEIYEKSGKVTAGKPGSKRGYYGIMLYAYNAPET